MKKVHLIFNLFFVLFSVACTESRHAINFLDRAENLMTKHPDSAKLILETINRESFGTRRGKARYALLYSQALDKNFIDVDVDTLIRVATAYYHRRGHANDRALAYFYSGRMYENGGKIDSAVRQYTRAEEYAKKTDNAYLKGLIANALAGLYSSQQFFALSQKKYLDAVASFTKAGNKLNTLKSYIGIIWMSVVEKKYDNMTSYLQEAERLALEIKDTTNLLYIERIKAIKAQEADADYRTALSILFHAYSKYNRAEVPISDYFLLGSIYLNLNKSDSAYIYLNRTMSHAASMPPRYQMETNYLMGKCLQKRGEYKQALDYMATALSIGDSLYFQKKYTSIPELKEKYRNEQLNLSNRYLRKQNILRIIISILILIGLSGIFTIVIYNRRKRILLQESAIKEYKTLVSTLKTEYDELRNIYNQKEDGSDMRMILNKRIDFIKNMLEVTAVYAYNKDVHINKIKEVLSDDQKRDNNILIIFREMFDMQCPGILKYLQDKYPKLSDTDINLYCLTCLDLSIQAVALAMGFSSKTIYNRRNLIKKSLNIQNETQDFKAHFEALYLEFKSKVPNRAF